MNKLRLRIAIFFITWLRVARLIPDVWYKQEIELAEIEGRELSEFFKQMADKDEA